MSVPAPSQVPTTRLAPPPPAPTKTKRIAGDDLIVELFEACSELHFMSDALHAAEFVLALTMDKMPSEVGLVSMFDINRREFVVVRQVGGKNSALCHRIPERAPLVANAMRSQRAVVIADARSDHRAVDERWTIIGVSPMTLVAAPVAVGGRYLGLLELANPLDGAAFTDGDGHALTYIGQQLGEYLAAQGVIVDQESILANQPDPTPKKAAPEQRASSSGKRR
jgi:GAF domain-containing protein